MMGGSAALRLPSVTPTCPSPLAAPCSFLAFHSFYSACQLEGPSLSFVSSRSLEFGLPTDFSGMATLSRVLLVFRQEILDSLNWFKNLPWTNLIEVQISCHVRIIMEGVASYLIWQQVRMYKIFSFEEIW